MSKYQGVSGPYFPVFGLNAEIYGKFCRITSSENSLASSFKIILSLFENLFEKGGTTVPQKCILSATFLVPKLLKHFFLNNLFAEKQKIKRKKHITMP